MQRLNSLISCEFICIFQSIQSKNPVQLGAQNSKNENCMIHKMKWNRFHKPSRIFNVHIINIRRDSSTVITLQMPYGCVARVAKICIYRIFSWRLVLAFMTRKNLIYKSKNTFLFEFWTEHLSLPKSSNHIQKYICLWATLLCCDYVWAGTMISPEVLQL